MNAIPKNKYIHLHIVILFTITFVFFNGFFQKNTMMNSSDQILILGLKTPFQKSIEEDKEFPYWNSTVFGGMPTSDALSGDFLYPPSIALSFIHPSRVFGIKMILHVFLAGLFFYLMLWRAFAFPPGIALIGAIFYMFNPQFISHIVPGHDGKMFVIAWVPFMIWHLKRTLDTPSLLSSTLLGLGIGMSILTSHIQMSYFAMWGLFAFWFIHTVTSLVKTKSIRAITGTSASFWGAVVIGVALGSIQIIPAIQFVNEHLSVRGADRTFETAASWSLNWAEVFSLWVPEFGNWFGWYWGGNTFKLNTEYAGAMASLLALLSLFVKGNRWRFFWAGVALFTLTLSLGKHTPLFTLAYEIIPGVKKFRALSMIMFWFSFSSVLLSALFLKNVYEEFWNNISEKGLKKLQESILIIMALCSFVYILFAFKDFTLYLMRILTPELMLSAKRQYIFELNFKHQFFPMLTLWWGIATTILIMFFFVLKKKLKKEWFLIAVLLLGAYDLFRVDSKFIETNDLLVQESSTAGYTSRTYKCELYRSNNNFINIPAEIVALKKKFEKEPFRVMFLPLKGSLMCQNIAGTFGLEGLGGYHDNELSTYNTFRGGKRSINYYRHLNNIPYSKVDKMLSVGSNHFNVSNCRYFILPEIRSSFAGNDRYSYTVVENKNVLPRISFTNKYIVCSNDSIALTKLTNFSFISGETVILEKKPEFTSTVDTLVTDISTEWIKYTANDRKVKVSIPTNGVLRISEVIYPGWTILVDGKEVSPIRADVTWMAIPITAGEHLVEMKIKSPFMPKFIPVSLVTAFFLLTYWIIFSIKSIICWKRRSKTN